MFHAISLLIMLSLPVLLNPASAQMPPLGAAAAGEPAVSYRLAVRLDPGRRELSGEAEITVDSEAPFELLLNTRFEAGPLRIDGESVEIRPHRHGALQRWLVPAGAAGRTLALSWHGTLAALAPGVEHRDTLGMQEPVADPHGSFLPSSSAWYPLVAHEGRSLLHAFMLSLDLPEGQHGLVAGHLQSESVRGGRLVARFDFPHPAEGIDLIAGPYRITERHVRSSDGRSVVLRTYFHDELEPLAAGYLDAVRDYLALYESWIGPYPFTSFAVVSSPTPTGFGMPTLTYLGIEVLKLPFIKDTSLGHEVLHNWWGNGVYPDYPSGNWSEGLTTFMADYHYAERAGAGKARAMRQGWLRDLSGIPPDADRPLAAFTSRTHGIDQAVGYGKAAMMFVMLRDCIGEPAFDRAIRRFWQTQRFRVADWDDLRVAFEAESHQRLERFFEQWLDRAGLAEVALVEGRAGEDRVAVTLTQSAPPYIIEVPLRIGTTEGEETRRVRLERTEQRFELELGAEEGATRITLDPENRLLRRLHRREAPPILREIQFDSRTALVTLGDATFTAHIRSLAMRLLDHPVGPQAAELAPSGRPLLVIGEHDRVLRWLESHDLPPPPPEVAGKGTLRMWTLRLDSGVPLAIIAAADPAALAAASRPLPHYGQQSWLVFDGAKAIGRGVWPAESVSVPVSHR
ncbi:M1 family metallopeptidase [Aromatoleum aromaticum]|uniref:M1 family metallopeptidase n=1 Tax=Aromatoleum aromaticum TaxID=551760 RepID=UPI0014593D44|nr:M1 family aminopeptidase [Aromatoleum aromaticum]NMG54421.1 M1 family peptidase [Aromatoleum aromaticum]